jgi:predicted amidohydrolase YtcJ
VEARSGACREGPIRRLDDFFAPTDEQRHAGYRAANDRCLALGITTASDFLLPSMVDDYDTVRSGDDGVRLFVHRIVSSVADIDAFPNITETERFRACGIKIFTDGAIGGRTAALFEAYADRSTEFGVLLFDDGVLHAMIRAAHERGWSAAVHAIGDRAIAQVLTAFAPLPPSENAACGHRIEHFELPRPEDVERMIATGVRPCVQPNFVGQWAGPGGLYETALGPERARRMNPFRTLNERGARPFFGSDGMPASPRFGLASAVQHPVEAERLTTADAHRLYTIEAADAVRRDRSSGRLEVGAHADLVVLPDTLETWIAGGRDEVDATILGGRLVYERVPLERAHASW